MKGKGKKRPERLVLAINLGSIQYICSMVEEEMLYLFDTGPASWLLLLMAIYISMISKQDGECRVQREGKGWKAEGKCRVFSLESADKLRTASSIKSRARTTTSSTRTPKGRGVRRVGARIDLGSVQDICSMVEEETFASVRYWTHRVLLTT